MPKIFEFECTKCREICEEWFKDKEEPPSTSKLECKKCRKVTKHSRIPFKRNNHRFYIMDSHYGDSVRK